MSPEIVKKLKELGIGVPANVQDMPADELITELLYLLESNVGYHVKDMLVEALRRWANYGEVFVKHENLIAAGVIFSD